MLMQIKKIEDKCNQCMLCVRDCVSGVWRIVDGKPVPTNPDLCNRCSHCISVCPCDAIRHDGLKIEQIMGVNRKNLNSDVYRDIILSRRSIRQFKDEPVPREAIEQVLDLARYAPTASNDQNVGYIVVTDKSLIEETAKKLFVFSSRLYDKTKKGIGRMVVNLTGLANNRYLKIMEYAQTQNAECGRDFVLYNAPVLILIHAPRKARFASDNCNIAATTIVNYAHALRLGTCFTGLLTMALQYSNTLRKKLSVPKNKRVYASLVLGYPAYRHTNTVSRKKAEVQWL
jgi:nitroreductase/NAD-dependent dihydropyrimidine dehydrogenase PreA subunit